MTKANVLLLINIVLFQCAWFSLVLGYTTLGMCITLGLFIHTALTSTQASKELLFCLLVVMFGVLADSILLQFDVYAFTASFDVNLGKDIIPLWLVALWLAFSLTLNRSLKWLVNMPWLLVIMMAVFGPLSYFAGSQLNPNQISINQELLAACVIQWAVIGFIIWGLYTCLLKEHDTASLSGEKHV